MQILKYEMRDALRRVVSHNLTTSRKLTPPQPTTTSSSSTFPATTTAATAKLISGFNLYDTIIHFKNLSRQYQVHLLSNPIFKSLVVKNDNGNKEVHLDINIHGDLHRHFPSAAITTSAPTQMSPPRAPSASAATRAPATPTTTISLLHYTIKILISTNIGFIKIWRTQIVIGTNWKNNNIDHILNDGSDGSNPVHGASAEATDAVRHQVQELSQDI